MPPLLLLHDHHNSVVDTRGSPDESTSLVLGPMTLLPNLLKLRLPQHTPPRTLPAPKAAEEAHQAAAFAGREAVQQAIRHRVIGCRRRRAEGDSRVDKDE